MYEICVKQYICYWLYKYRELIRYLYNEITKLQNMLFKYKLYIGR
jgi:hypothetical protein